MVILEREHRAFITGCDLRQWFAFLSAPRLPCNLLLRAECPTSLSRPPCSSTVLTGSLCLLRVSRSLYIESPSWCIARALWRSVSFPRVPSRPPLAAAWPGRAARAFPTHRSLRRSAAAYPAPGDANS
eukprot:Gb_35470 [translate_table: standard]